MLSPFYARPYPFAGQSEQPANIISPCIRKETPPPEEDKPCPDCNIVNGIRFCWTCGHRDKAVKKAIKTLLPYETTAADSAHGEFVECMRMCVVYDDKLIHAKCPLATRIIANYIHENCAEH